jgi:hypothetical protein
MRASGTTCSLPEECGVFLQLAESKKDSLIDLARSQAERNTMCVTCSRFRMRASPLPTHLPTPDAPRRSECTLNHESSQAQLRPTRQQQTKHQIQLHRQHLHQHPPHHKLRHQHIWTSLTRLGSTSKVRARGRAVEPFPSYPGRFIPATSQWSPSPLTAWRTSRAQAREDAAAGETT